MPILAELPDIDAALAKLDAAEASFEEAPGEAFVQTDDPARPQSAPSEAKAAEKPDSDTTDTRAAAGEKPAEAKEKVSETPPKPGEKPAELKPGEAKASGSAFKQNADRLDKTWKAVNERKVQLDGREQQLAQREQQLVVQEQRIKLQEARSAQKYSPEQYEQASQTRAQNADGFDLQADGLERRADKLEESGDYANAERARAQAKGLREQAIVERSTAKQLKDYAGHLRANPSPTVEQHQAQKARELQHYTTEAAKAWPELAQSGSEFQKRTAAHLNAAAKYGLDANENPAIMYFAAQLTHFERTAARVPEMEKELGELRAKVKDYEKLTAPGGGGEASTRPQAQKPASAEDEGEALRAEALTFS